MKFIESLKRLLERYDQDDEKEALAEFEGVDLDRIRTVNFNHKYKMGSETFLVFKGIEKAQKEAYDRVYSKVKNNYKKVDWDYVGGFEQYITDDRMFEKLQKELSDESGEELTEYEVLGILEDYELIDDERLIEDILYKTPLVDILSPDKGEEDIMDYEGNTYYIYRL